MTTTTTTAVRRSTDRPVIPVPRRAADDEPDRAASEPEWITYPGVRYALEALRRSGADRVH